jgi:hypothetical protein
MEGSSRVLWGERRVRGFKSVATRHKLEVGSDTNITDIILLNGSPKK